MTSNDTGCGCGVLLLLALLGLVWPLLPTILGLALVVGLLALVAALVTGAMNAQSRRRLRRIAAQAEQRFAGDICRLDMDYGQMKAIGVAPADPARSGLRLTLQLHVLEPAEQHGGQAEMPLQLSERQLELVVPPGQIERLASSGEFGRFLRSQGVSMINDLAVEARATQAAFQCLRERDWAEASQRRLEEMVNSTRTTLAKAGGNELLEPSIPQLQKALGSFQAEQQKLKRHRQESETMLRKLHDFLSVPETIRPILSFDLEGLFDPSRLQDLRASFEEVVTLNDSYRALSRDRII